MLARFAGVAKPPPFFEAAAAGARAVDEGTLLRLD